MQSANILIHKNQHISIQRGLKCLFGITHYKVNRKITKGICAAKTNRVMYNLIITASTYKNQSIVWKNLADSDWELGRIKAKFSNQKKKIENNNLTTERSFLGRNYKIVRVIESKENIQIENPFLYIDCYFIY